MRSLKPIEEDERTPDESRDQISPMTPMDGIEPLGDLGTIPSFD